MKLVLTAIEQGDQNKFLDLVDPPLRSNPNNAFLFLHFSANVFGVGVTGGASDISFRNVSTSVTASDASWATVDTTAAVRYAGVEHAFHEIEVVHNISGRWYVSDQDERNKNATAGTRVTTFGPQFPPGNATLFAVAADGAVYVVSPVERYSNEETITRIDPSGSAGVVFHGTGIRAITVSPNGRVLFGADVVSNQTMTLFELEPDGSKTTRAKGIPLADSTLLATADGSIFLSGGFLVRLDSAGTVIGRVEAGYSGGQYGIFGPLAIDSQGRLFAASNRSNKGILYSVSPSLSLLEVSAIPYDVTGFSADTAGNLYFVRGNGTQIFRLRPGEKPGAIAGTTDKAYADGDSQSARFENLFGLASDGSGALYVMDSTRDVEHRVIRKIVLGGSP